MLFLICFMASDITSRIHTQKTKEGYQIHEGPKGSICFIADGFDSMEIQKVLSNFIYSDNEMMMLYTMEEQEHCFEKDVIIGSTMHLEWMI